MQFTDFTKYRNFLNPDIINLYMVFNQYQRNVVLVVLTVCSFLIIA